MLSRGVLAQEAGMIGLLAPITSFICPTWFCFLVSIDAQAAKVEEFYLGAELKAILQIHLFELVTESG